MNKDRDTILDKFEPETCMKQKSSEYMARFLAEIDVWAV